MFRKSRVPTCRPSVPRHTGRRRQLTHPTSYHPPKLAIPRKRSVSDLGAIYVRDTPAPSMQSHTGLEVGKTSQCLSASVSSQCTASRNSGHARNHPDIGLCCPRSRRGHARTSVYGIKTSPRGTRLHLLMGLGYTFRCERCGADVPRASVYADASMGARPRQAVGSPGYDALAKGEPDEARRRRVTQCKRR
jgi:hypothetical protein